MTMKDLQTLITFVFVVLSALQLLDNNPASEVSKYINQTPPSPQSSPPVLGESTNAVASTSAIVTRVVDGDTIHVKIDGKQDVVRLIGINTPETVDPRRSVECFGKEASNKAKELLNGQKVYLESDLSQSDRDKYDRILRYVWLEDGRNFNKVMIAEGYAYEYTYDNPYKYQAEFRQAQLDAQVGKKGLWSENTCKGEK